MANNFGIYNITAELEASPSASLYGALSPPSGNINLRRKPERDQRDREELAVATGLSSGNRSVFVLAEVSSSMHEVTSKNAYRSGSVPLESTPVPASASIYYSKRQRFVKLTYALTASSGLSTLPTSQDKSPAVDEYAARGTFDPISGSYRNTTIFNPSVFEINVPEHGKIRDVKVWVEFIHDHRGGPGSGSFSGNPFLAGGTGAPKAYPKQGLQGVQVALRSPNVQFDFAHPLWNNETVRNLEKWPTSQVSSFYRKVPEILKSSYLLWAGHSCEEDLGYALGAHTGSSSGYLPSSPYTIRDVTSSSFAPGVGSANEYDSSPNYELFSYYPAFRTLSSIPVAGNQVGVLYPTGVPGSPIYDTNGYYFWFDNGAGVNPVPQMFFTSSSGVAYGLTPCSSRVRAEKGSNRIHAMTIWPGTGTAYGIRELGDTNFKPWTLRWPVVTGDESLGLHIPIGADCFFDFALDSNNAAHFIANQWRGDLGRSCLNYGFVSGPVTTEAYVPPGTIQDKALPVGTFNRFFKSRTMNVTVGVGAGNNVTISVDSVYNYVVGQTVRFGYGSGPYTGVITSIPGATSIIVDNLPIPLVIGDDINMWGGSSLWTQSGSLMIMGELDNPTVNYGLTTPAGSVGGYCQIEIDNRNMIHIVYTDTANKSVKYAKKPVAYTQWTGSWSFELIHTHSAPSTWPTHISLDIDSSGNPHVAYSLYDGLTDNIYYAKSGSGGWNLELVRSASGLKLGTRLKLDNFGSPNIVACNKSFDGDGNEGVVIFTSSSQVGWAQRLIHSSPTDDPREFTITFSQDNLARVYSGGGRLSAIWETTSPQDGKYNEYNTDIDMRTVFTDSSVNNNPRNLTTLYENPTSVAPGDSTLCGALILDSRAYPSPFSASIPLLQTAGMWGAAASHVFEPTIDQSNHLTSSNVPWMFDSRVPPGIFHGLNYQALITASLGLTPPLGWLTGPGGTANANEFPTVGANLGPADIQPVYPLLDDVFVEKITDQTWLNGTTSVTPGVNPLLPFSRKKLIGFRPGLRGTDINGIWRLMIGVAGDVVTATQAVTGSSRAGIWFRQVRLEFLVDVGEESKQTYASKSFRFKRSGNARRVGNSRLAIMSGSSAWDVGINYVVVPHDAEYGRSVGITDSTGSDQFSVFSQITGSLVDLLSGSGGIYNVRNSYLKNEFGTPYIPISSGSAAIPSFDTFSEEEIKQSKTIFQETLNPKTLVPKDNTLRAHLSRAQVLKTTRDVMFSKIKFTK